MISVNLMHFPFVEWLVFLLSTPVGCDKIKPVPIWRLGKSSNLFTWCRGFDHADLVLVWWSQFSSFFGFSCYFCWKFFVVVILGCSYVPCFFHQTWCNLIPKIHQVFSDVIRAPVFWSCDLFVIQMWVLGVVCFAISPERYSLQNLHISPQWRQPTSCPPPGSLWIEVLSCPS